MVSELKRPPLILLYGRETSLLETRGWVLEKGGSAVCLAQSSEAYTRLLKADPVKLVVLCYTLSAEQVQAAIRALQSLTPPVHGIVMTATHTEIPNGCLLQTFRASAGPQALIELVHEILGT